MDWTLCMQHAIMAQLHLFLKKENFWCLARTLHIVIPLQVICNEKRVLRSSLIVTGYELIVFFQFSGLVTDLKDVHVTQVSLGKAHAVALTNKGQVYTFGINNKGQCGRDFASQIKEGMVYLNVIYVGELKILNLSQFMSDRLGTVCHFFSLFFDLRYTVCFCSPSWWLAVSTVAHSRAFMHITCF